MPITKPTIGQDPWGVDLNATLDQIGDMVTNVTDAAYGAAGDGITNDTTAVQAAITAVSGIGGGVVYFPAGTYLVSSLTVPAKVRLVGAGRQATVIKKSTNGVLVSMSGPSTDTTSATHVKYGGIENLSLNGNSLTGNLLQLFYADNMVFRDVHFTSNLDVMVDTAEFWDSLFLNCTFETCGGAADSVTPMVYLRNSAAASGFGFSADNSNNIKFVGCRWEDFRNGALRIDQGVGNSNNPNVIFITDCKMETSAIRGGSHLLAADECRAVYVNGLYCYAGGFFSGYATAQNIINWAPQASSLENVHIANGATATIAAGVDLFSGASSTASLTNVTGQYTTAPTGAHIRYEASSTADFRVENSYGSAGTQASGTVPIRYAGHSPLKQVAGVPVDGDFTHTPLNGTQALDTVTGSLYVRNGGVWVLAGTATGDVQTFTAGGTWTKPSGAKTVTIVAIGGGGGGGSGAREPSGTVSSGGAGGGGGAYTIRTVPAALLSATETVTVGAGGAGGTAITTNGTVGNPGVSGGNSVFKATTFLVANAGVLGGGGSTGAATGGSGGGGGSNGGAGASSSATGLVGSNGTSTGIAAPGGGSGGGVTTAPAASAGGAGGSVSSSGGNAGGTAGTAGNAGGAGVSVTAGSPLAGTAGGGGGSATAAVGGTGGAGGVYGAGGGGGGASLDGSNSGAGGAGAAGIVIVMTAA